MSVPPGTERFQFPGFASAHYGFMYGYPLLGGLPHSDIHGSTPARGSPWLFAACHVLHRLLVPRHPPNALLILNPERARARPHHARKPSSVISPQWSVIRCHEDNNHRRGRLPQARSRLDHPYSAHNRSPSSASASGRKRDPIQTPPTDPFHASEPSPPDRWGACPIPTKDQTALPVRHAIGQRDTGQTFAHPASHAPRDAPEPDSP